MGVLFTVDATLEKLRLDIVGSDVEGGGTVDIELPELARNKRVTLDVSSQWSEWKSHKDGIEIEEISLASYQEATERVEMVRRAKGELEGEIEPLLATVTAYEAICGEKAVNDETVQDSDVERTRLKEQCEVEAEERERLHKALASFKTKEGEFLLAQQELECALRHRHEQQRRQIHVAVTAFHEEASAAAHSVQARQHYWVPTRAVHDGEDAEISDWERSMLKHHADAQLEHVRCGMIMAKRSHIDYREYLRAKMPSDFHAEFVSGERKNERYRAMWKSLSAESEIVRKYTDPVTNAILDVDSVAAQSTVVGVLGTESFRVPRTALEVASVWVNSLVQRRRNRLKVLLQSPAIALGDQLRQLQEAPETQPAEGDSTAASSMTLAVHKGPDGFGMVINSDCTVARVTGPAKDAGVQIGSRIHAVNAEVVSTKFEIVAQLQLISSDDPAYFTVEPPLGHCVIPADMYYDAMCALRCEIREWMELIPWYKGCAQCYSFLSSTADSTLVPFIKPSKLKKDARFAFVATNLCVQQWQLRPVPAMTIGDEAQWSGEALQYAMAQPIDTSLTVTTSGCSTAHYLGYKAGLRRMEQENDQAGIAETKVVVEKEAAISRRRDVALGQSIANASTAFFSSLENIAAAPSDTVPNGDSDANEAMRELLLRGEFLIVIESLLSVAGSEMAMLEDLADCTSQLNECVTFVCSPHVAQGALSQGHGSSVNSVVGVSSVTSTELEVHMKLDPACYALISPARAGEDVGESQPISVAHMWESEPESEPTPREEGGLRVTRVKLTAMLFTRGINEQQAKARQEAKLRKEIRRNLTTQDEINGGSLAQLRRFIDQHASGDESPSQRYIEQLFRQAGAVVLDTKGAVLLQHIALLARALGGARVTHCKSGKDRTSMSCTLEEVQLLSSSLGRLQLQHRIGTKPTAAAGEAGAAVDGVALSAAQDDWCQVLRAYGVRRENVRLNTGKDVYAFNKVQASFLPEEYRPPPGSHGKAAS
eukprot:COSAG02_NODE_2415_length_8913_cov_2.989676_8_plen_997_part_00